MIDDLNIYEVDTEELKQCECGGSWDDWDSHINPCPVLDTPLDYDIVDLN